MSDEIEFPEFEDLTPEEVSEEEAPQPRRKIRWQVIVLAVGLVLIVASIVWSLILGPGGPPTERTVSFSTSQVYTEGIVGEPQFVNPLLATSQADRDLVALVYSGLTRIDDYGQPAPDLAESWTVSSDGLIYTFKLRQGPTWHDGVPVTADDVAYTMSLLRDPDFTGPAGLASFWRTVETYADDPQTVRFVLTQPLSAFPEYAGIGLLPSHILNGLRAADLPRDPINLAPIGTGRLRWIGFEQSLVKTVKLVPYTGFYDPARVVKLEEIDLKFYPNDPNGNRAFGALGTDTQAMGGLNNAQLNAVLSSGGLNLYSARLPYYTALIFNQGAPARLPFFRDEVVRKALTMALDRESLVTQTLAREAIPTNSTILSGTWAYNSALTPQPVDAAQAAALLDQAGYPLQGGVRTNAEGVKLSFTLIVTDGAIERQIGQAAVDAWRGLGVDAKMQTMSAAREIELLQTPPGDDGRGFDMALVEFGQGGLADPDQYPFWHESQVANGQNFSGFVDRDISEMLEVARRDANGVRRADLYKAFQQAFLDRAAAILLYNPLYHYAVSCQVQGVQVVIYTEPADRFRNMQDWRIIPADQVEQYCNQ